MCCFYLILYFETARMRRMVFVFDVPMHTLHQNQVLPVRGRLSDG